MLQKYMNIDFLCITETFSEFLNISGTIFWKLVYEHICTFLKYYKDYFFIKSWSFLFFKTWIFTAVFLPWLDRVHSNGWMPTQVKSTRTWVNKNQHKPDTNQHESDRSQHEPGTSQRESDTNQRKSDTIQLNQEVIIGKLW